MGGHLVEVGTNEVPQREVYRALAPGLVQRDLQLTADVTAADTVTCVLSNSTAGAVDLAAFTVKVLVTQTS